MNVIFSNFINVGHSDLFNASAISLQEVCGVSVKLIGHALSQDLLFGVEGENKRVQDCVLGRAQLGLLDPAFADFDELVVQSVQSGGGAVTLGAHRYTEDARMAVSCANPTPAAVGQTKLGAKVCAQTGCKASAEKLVESFNGIVIGIAPLDAQVHHADVALINVVFLDQEQAMRRVECNLRGLQARSLRQPCKRGTEFTLLLRGIKIARHAKNDVVR